MAHQRVFAACNLGHDRLQRFPAPVVIAVARGPGKMGFTHPMMNKRGQYFPAVIFRNFLHPGKRLGALLLRFLPQLFQPWINVKKFLFCLFHWNGFSFRYKPGSPGAVCRMIQPACFCRQRSSAGETASFVFPVCGRLQSHSSPQREKPTRSYTRIAAGLWQITKGVTPLFFACSAKAKTSAPA